MAMSEQYSVSALPRITYPKFVRILSANDYGDVPGRLSPMLPDAEAIYSICVDAVPRIDPSCWAAWAFSETEFGTTGLCKTAKLFNPGNVRSPFDKRYGGVAIDFGARGKFTRYTNWLDAVRDWCARMAGPSYMGAGHNTIEEIMKVYAPSSDGNRVQDRIDKTYKLVNAWA